MQKQLPYVIVTPACNEQKYIGNAIDAMLGQTHRPLRWIIVSDGSTDETPTIVKRYSSIHSWMQLVQLSKNSSRSFSSKARAFNVGYSHVKQFNYEVIGNLDADTSFEPDYFEYLINQFAIDQHLGVAGTPFREDCRVAYDYQFTDISHVSGICQLFRRACFEEIGGYTPIKGGGIDWVAVTTARMKGWTTRTFTEKAIVHHRPIGTATASRLRVSFNQGMKDYNLGNCGTWEVFRTIYQTRKSKPYLIAAVILFCGYTFALIRNRQRPIDNELTRFIQKEQRQRLLNLIITFKHRLLGTILGEDQRSDAPIARQGK
jgi:poly-beta-1,6-N-acetyl-D-glucosamine synthase